MLRRRRSLLADFFFDLIGNSFYKIKMLLRILLRRYLFFTGIEKYAIISLIYRYRCDAGPEQRSKGAGGIK